MELTGPSIFSMMMKSAALAAGTMLLPAGAQETEIVPEAAAEAVTEAAPEEASGPEEGAGTGLIAFDPQSEAPDDVRLIFHAPDYAQEDILFVRTDEP